MPTPVKEATIVDRIMKYLKSLGPHVRAEKTHGGSYGKAGKPDITGCINGRRFEIEVKNAVGKPMPLQIKTLEEWSAAGAITGIARSVDDVKRILAEELAKLSK
jgi:hypothetical protein